MGALIGGAIIAIGLITDFCYTEVFVSWVVQILLPDSPAKSVIVKDNTSFHKGKDMQKFWPDFSILSSLFT
ncbi:hypothetical protein HE1_00882 [Holospora elegans E1]|nr:hypothetical protein HE1_00882 [Holospora elegans E1]